MDLDEYHRERREAASRRNRIELGFERPHGRSVWLSMRALAGLLRSWWVIWGVMLGTLLAIFLASPWSLEELRIEAAGRNCASAKAVGLAPIRRGGPGYYWWNDRDGDGVACEWWHPRR